jgi:hypothetical protein
MKIYLIVLPAIIICFGFFSLPQETPRRVLIFGKDYPEFKTQLTFLANDSAGVAERDIVIEKFEATEAAAKKYNVNPKEFTVLLIGKDGYEKYRDNKPIELKDLFALIDSMPMRKNEMERKSRN